MTTVEIDRDDLEILLDCARKGDKAASRRSWRNGFRHVSVCSEHPERFCPSCQAFAAAEEALEI